MFGGPIDMMSFGAIAKALGSSTGCWCWVPWPCGNPGGGGSSCQLRGLVLALGVVPVTFN